MANEKVRERNKEKVIRVAARLFEEVGVEQATIRRIAAESELSTRSVMNYFSTKIEIVKAVLQLKLDEAYSILKFFMEQEDYQRQSGFEQLMSLSEYILRYAKEQGNNFRCLLEMEVAIFSREDLDSEQYYRGSGGNFIAQALEKALVKGVGDGSVRADIPLNQGVYVTLSYALSSLFRRIVLTKGNDYLSARYDLDDMIHYYLLITRNAFMKTS